MLSYGGFTIFEVNMYMMDIKESKVFYLFHFVCFSEAAQKLYVRLFQRKYKWLRLNKINYPNITQDPEKPLNELVTAGLIDLGT